LLWYRTTLEVLSVSLLPSGMKSVVAIFFAAAADATNPCLCIFDVDSTLISWSTHKHCPKTQRTGIYDGSYEILRAEGSYRLSETFCNACWAGVISAGSAGTQGGDERKDLVKMLQQGGHLPTDTWNPSGCHNKGHSPLITSCSNKPSAVPGIIQYYKNFNGVHIADKDVHFFDDEPSNIVVFEGSSYNAHQISCGTTGGTTGGLDGGDNKCAASLEEVNNSPGIKYCCSGSQVAPASSSRSTTQCGTPCHFPFKYSGKTYHECTTHDDVAPWCATKRKYDDKNWGYCHGGNSDAGVNQTTSDVIV